MRGGYGQESGCDLVVIGGLQVKVSLPLMSLEETSRRPERTLLAHDTGRRIGRGTMAGASLRRPTHSYHGSGTPCGCHVLTGCHAIVLPMSFSIKVLSGHLPSPDGRLWPSRITPHP